MLDGAQHAPFAWGDEEDGRAFPTCAAGTADPVHVGLGVIGYVVIDNVSDALHVQSARRDVGGDDDVQRSFLEPLDDLLAQDLRHVAVQRRRLIATRLQLLGQFHGFGFGAHKDDHRVDVIGVQDAG